MGWAVAFLADADADMHALAKGGMKPPDMESAIRDQFTGFKADRVRKLLESGTSTAALDRLDSSAYPTSIRLQVLQDLRATVWLVPLLEQAIVVHVFHKAQDPEYRRAGSTHDARLEAYIQSFHEFAQRRRAGRRPSRR